ncbi:MAG: hydrogenase expression protein, partial [Thermovirga sp.]|nr:hydrogenase expression protein [Thermovirga sp.]
MVPNKVLQEFNSGKLPPEALKSAVLSFCGSKRPEVLVGPKVGEDAAVIKWGEGDYLVITTDPIVGATQGAGRLLVTVNSNDVAAKGGDPCYLATTMIFPKHTTKDTIETVAREIHEACQEIGVAVVSGHTEINERYTFPVICGTMVGKANRVLSADHIISSDLILVTKHAGLEGMSILAADRPDLLGKFLSPSEIEEAKSWISRTSILKEAKVLRKYARF